MFSARKWILTFMGVGLIGFLGGDTPDQILQWMGTSSCSSPDNHFLSTVWVWERVRKEGEKGKREKETDIKIKRVREWERKRERERERKREWKRESYRQRMNQKDVASNEFGWKSGQSFSLLTITVKTKAMYLSVIGLGYSSFVLDRLPLAQSLSRMLSRKRFKITRLAVC